MFHRVASPFERMYLRGQIDPDFIINRILHGAGVRYYTDWYLSGITSISAIKSAVGCALEAQAFLEAREYLGDRYSAVVDPIVIEGGSIASVQRVYANRGAHAAVALERLNVGLRRLGVHYHLLKP